MALAAVATVAGCGAPHAGTHSASHHEKYSARPYDMHGEAMPAVDAALAEADATGKHVLLVMGANWCHDSRGLAGLLETPRFAELIAASYVPVFIDAGKPREDAANNIEVARRFGVDRLIGTPNVFVINADAERLNSVEDVTGWTDAASREEDMIYDFLVSMAPTAS